MEATRLRRWTNEGDESDALQRYNKPDVPRFYGIGYGSYYLDGQTRLVLHMQLAYMHTPLQRQLLHMCLDAMQF